MNFLKNCLFFDKLSLKLNLTDEFNNELTFQPIESMPMSTYNRMNIHHDKISVCGPLIMILKEYSIKNKYR